MLEKIDSYFIPFQKKHPVVTIIAIIIFAIIIIILFIPLCMLFIAGSILHSCFYTGVVNKKVNNKPERTWV